ncbi:MAG TPA: hypothetical protein VK306_10880 [Acidimicrobiales bacterium]|nr:hypothetical protein [Acidimicrobiales bacterium]
MADVADHLDDDEGDESLDAASVPPVRLLLGGPASSGSTRASPAA